MACWEEWTLELSVVASSPLYVSDYGATQYDHALLSYPERAFEDKVHRLLEHLPAVSQDEAIQYLTACAGVYDTAYALLLQSVQDEQVQAEKQRQQNYKDHAVAMALQEEESSLNSVSPVASSNSPNCISQYLGQADLSSQYDGRGQLPVEHPKGKTKLECMQDILPKADDGVHQNILVTNDGGVSQAVQCQSQMPGIRPNKSSRKYTPPATRKSLLPSSTGLNISRPVTPSPGFRHLAVPAAAANRPARKVDNIDIYNEARKGFRHAREQLAVCKQEARAAQQGNNQQKQALCLTQSAYWQRMVVQEKQKAQQTIFASKNADITNTFKIELTAQHVGDALMEIEETRQRLTTRFSCIWMVEIVTDKTQYRLEEDPNFLPSIKQYLKLKKVDFWEPPGMLVFSIIPRGHGW